jgi:hypothetical protein
MSTQVAKLEALLQRVQRNRDQPRAAAPAASAPAARASVAQPVPVAVPVASPQPAAARAGKASLPQPVSFAKPAAQPVQSSKAPVEPARPKVAASPLQAAVESRLSRPGGAVEEIRGEMLSVEEPVASGKPIAQVVSKHPPTVALSFGELLRRSLALRPR